MDVIITFNHSSSYNGPSNTLAQAANSTIFQEMAPLLMYTYYGGLPFAHGISYENGSQVLDDWWDFENIFILMISSSLPNKNYQLKKISIPVMKIV